jgi:hypothetical protein
MTFEEVAERYTVLRQQRDAGLLPDAQFRQTLAQLVAADAGGSFWQIDADSGQWVVAASAAPYPQPPLSPPRPYSQQEPYSQPQPPQEEPAPKKNRWGQVVWDIFSVAGSAVMSAVWYWYSGMADTKPDYNTCVAMVLLPVLLIVFRKPLDRLLRPVDSVRQKIPPMVLAGCGVATPFLVANYLYSSGVTQFPFMFKTYVYSMLISYIVLRTPTGGRVMAPPRVPGQGF